MKLGRLLSLAVVTAGLVLIGSESRAAAVVLPSNAAVLATAPPNTVTYTAAPGWSIIFNAITAGGTQPQPLAAIAVNALSLAGSPNQPQPSSTLAVPPIGFQLTGSITSATQNNSSDLLIDYTVIAPVPIVSVTLVATGGSANGGASLISETITNLNGNTPDGNFSLGGGGQVTFVLPVASNMLRITKDINSNGGSNPGGIASYSDVRNSFNTVIPEPASVVLLGCGLVGVLGLGLRRTKKTA
jgi:hypothetical protein